MPQDWKMMNTWEWQMKVSEISCLPSFPPWLPPSLLSFSQIYGVSESNRRRPWLEKLIIPSTTNVCQLFGMSIRYYLALGIEKREQSCSKKVIMRLMQIYTFYGRVAAIAHTNVQFWHPNRNSLVRVSVWFPFWPTSWASVRRWFQTVYHIA